MNKAISAALLILVSVLFATVAFSASQTVTDTHATISRSTDQGITLEFSLTDCAVEVVREESGTFDRYTLESEGYTAEYGKPTLPAVTRVVVVPPDAGLELLIHAGTPRRVKADNPPLLGDVKSSAVLVDDNPSISGIYPLVVAEMSSPFVMRGVRMVRVTTYPVRYDSENSEYLLYDELEAEIRFTDDEPENPSRCPIRRNRSAEFMKFIRNFAMNGESVRRDDPDRDREPEYVGHYLIAMHENCLEYAVPFIEWRRKSGWKVDLLTLTSNEARNSTTIKNRIQERYDAYLEDGVDPFDQLMLIGDHDAFSPNMPFSPNWILTSPAGNSIWPHNDNHYDWHYACLEGGNNDIYADVGLSRWISGSRESMQLFVHRTLSYEMEPYMEDTEWFGRGAVYAQRWGGNYHVSLATNVRWAKSVFQSLGFDDIRTFEQFNADINAIGQFLTAQFNDGVNVMLGRAENYFWRTHFNGVRANVIYPIDLCMGGHHEWTCWNMLRHEPNIMRGPVAASTGWGGPRTLWMSICWLEAVNGFMLQDQTWGWSRIKGVVGPEAIIPNFNGIYPQRHTDIMYYGDPGIQYWKGVPIAVDADFPEAIYPTDRLVNVYVMDAEFEQDLSGAQVTLYAPGDMPDGNDEDYADYDDMFMMTKKTDSEGFTRFVLPEGLDLEPGTMYVTVTGREILPLLEELEIAEPESGISLAGWTLEEVEGNEDEDVNPGETFTLSLVAHNLDNNNEATNVTARITSLSSYLEIGEENVIEFDDIDADGDAEGQNGVTIQVAADCPDGASRPVTRPAIKIEFASNDDRWRTAIELDPVAPNFVISEIVSGEVLAAGINRVRIEIENIGRMATGRIDATIATLAMGMSVVESDAVFPGLGPGETGRAEGEGFRVSTNTLVPPGFINPSVLILHTEGGFVDSAFFTLQVSEPRENAPQGPDKYGYICFDDTDVDWEVAPEYDWIEICPDDDDHDFEGDEIDIARNSPNDVGATEVINLPFETQFYGILYNQITIASNGFISMGNQEYVTNYQNWPMDRAIGGGVGMLAPFWDDLKFINQSGIYSYHDRENSVFIVEWYQMNHRSGGNTPLTFQVILYDHAIWITETGDQNIKFQYKEIRDVAGRNDNWYTASPYASIGISSPYGDTGINYSFNDRRPVTSAPIANQRALMFSTSPRYRSGLLYGRVTDVANGNGIENAVITTQHGFSAITDEVGDWRIEDALAEVEFSITCVKQGYNDSTKYNQFVPEDDSLEINYELLHPEFTPSVYNLAWAMDPELRHNMRFSLENTGNGPLNWKVERRLLGDANAPPWQFRRTYNVGNDVEDTRIQGVIFAENKFFVSGSHDEAPLIYVFDREGEFIESFAQPQEDARYGVKDMAWDGNLIWGAVDDTVYGFTTEGEIIHRWESEFNPTSNIAWDPEREILWVSHSVTDLIAYTPEGQRLEEYELNRYEMRIYGLAYWTDDPDGFPLYALHKTRDTDEQALTKYNPETGDTMNVAIINPEGVWSSPGGAFITNKFDVYSFVLISILNSPPGEGGDRIDIWQIAARRDWFRLDIAAGEEWVEADSGRLETREESEFMLKLNSNDLPDTLFQSELFFTHNADSGRGHIFIDLAVIGPEPPGVFDLAFPADGDTLDSTAVTLQWNPSVDRNDGEEVGYATWISNGADSASFETADTSLVVNIDSLGFEYDSNTSFWWWVNAVSGEDMTPCNNRFVFYPPLVSGAGLYAGTPVEFSLKSIHPNPFNAAAKITFGIENSDIVRLNAYDVTGRKVAKIFSGNLERGYHQVVWDASSLPSGIYILHLESAGKVQIRKTALLR